MSLTIKLSTLALTLGAVLSTNAYAKMDAWDGSESLPWSASTTAQYAEWNEFAWTTASASTKTYYDATPDVDGVGTLKATGTPLITSTSNVYSWDATTSYSVALAGTSGGYFDVYMSAATFGLKPSSVAYLNGVAATTYKQTFYQLNGEQMGQPDAEYEFYFKWSNVAGADLYTFTWSDLTAHTSLDQLAVATVQVTVPTTPVPEPESYAMILAGLGLIGLVGRRKKIS